MSTPTYDPASVLVSFKGSLLSGFAPDTFIQAERNEDAFTLTIGAGGEGARTKNNNRSGLVTLTLMASSIANDALSAIAAADELGGTGVGELFIKELGGTTLVQAANAWVKKLPATSRAKELGIVEWVFECEQLSIFNGGLA